jgi:hypothetical protein
MITPGVIVVLVMCFIALVTTLSTIIFVGDSRLKEYKPKWWERLIMVIGLFCSILIIMSFALMLLIDRLKISEV